ncbi:MAG: hypothetical protein HYU63_00465 [Armatimonadetes bacterium]|nr:hypothetical protein [Armatimonadota bacterium]
MDNDFKISHPQQIPSGAEWILKKNPKSPDNSLETSPTPDHTTLSSKKEIKREKILRFIQGAKEIEPKEALDDKIKKLIAQALILEYGESILKNPGYPQLENKLAQVILEKHPEKITSFLDTLS